MEEQNNQQEFLVTARKWRPLSFNSVVGQGHITTTLQNAVRTGRIHHAYLFSGPRGVGKTTTARILARAINCTNPQADNEPCNECESCRSIIEGRALDVIEIDGASNNSVDDIRNLRENSRYLPTSGKYKIYIIDEVHMLSTSAFNALLKTLEEPPPHLLFIFATTEPHKVLPTILSRCQRFEFKRMEISDIVRQLGEIAQKENMNIDEKSLITIAKKGDGSMRDSQSIFDQVIAFCGSDVDYSKMADALHLIDQDFFFRITDDIKTKNLSDIFMLTKQLLDKGYDLKETMEGLVEHIRNILTVKVTDTNGLVEASKESIERYKETAEHFSQNDLLRLLVLASNAENQLKYASQPRIKFETSLLQMASVDTTLQISELIAEIRNLKKKSNSVVDTEYPQAQKAENNKIMEPAARQIIQPPVENKVDVGNNISMENKLPIENKAPDSPRPKITGDYLRDNWNNFLDQYANTQNKLSILKDINNNNDPNNTIKFDDSFITFFVSPFIAEKLEIEKNTIQDKLKEFYGSNLEIVILRNSGNEQGNAPNNSNNLDKGNNKNKTSTIIINSEMNKQKSDNNNNNNKHNNLTTGSELEKKIVTMFNAQLIS